MDAKQVTMLVQSLRSMDAQLEAVAIATGQLTQPTDYQARAELAAYVRELNLTAAAWQTQNETLLRLLSDHPCLSVPEHAPQQPVQADLLDIQYKRMGFDHVWERKRPYAYLHAGEVQFLVRPSFRDIYRRVLQSCAQLHGSHLIDVCLQSTERIPMTTDRDTYHHATEEHFGYIFNVQLAADDIRSCIRSLYRGFGWSPSQFAVWVS
jgi:hypothetical protein